MRSMQVRPISRFSSPREALIGRMRMAAPAIGNYYNPGALAPGGAIPPFMPIPRPYRGMSQACFPGCGTSGLNQSVMSYNAATGQFEEACGKARVYPLNLIAQNVAPNATATATSSPQMMFKANRIFVPSGNAANFVINNIFIGTKPQIVDASGVGTPAQIYSEVAVNNIVEFDTAYPGILVAISVTNISAQTDTIRITLLGPAVEGN